MLRTVFQLSLAISSVFYTTAHIFDIHCDSNLAVYWGQNNYEKYHPGMNQLPLDEYCDKNTGNVIILSYLSEFNAGDLKPPVINFSNSCVTTFANSTLLHCPDIAKAIDKCQKQGKIVLLSMGGITGISGFLDSTQGTHYADKIWDMFLGGNVEQRPFDDVILDGIDLNIEGGSSIGYSKFAQRLRERFLEYSDKRFYVTASPQCTYPDIIGNPILDNSFLDMVFVQFFNNYCGVDKPNWFNYDRWNEWATTISPNREVKIFLGIPGSPTAAGTGYIGTEQLVSIVNATRRRYSSLGGVSLWDASQADGNKVEQGVAYSRMVETILDAGKICVPGVGSVEPVSLSDSVKPESDQDPEQDPVSEPESEPESDSETVETVFETVPGKETTIVVRTAGPLTRASSKAGLDGSASSAKPSATTRGGIGGRPLGLEMRVVSRKRDVIGSKLPISEMGDRLKIGRGHMDSDTDDQDEKDNARPSEDRTSRDKKKSEKDDESTADAETITDTEKSSEATRELVKEALRELSKEASSELESRKSSEGLAEATVIENNGNSNGSKESAEGPTEVMVIEDNGHADETDGDSNGSKEGAEEPPPGAVIEEVVDDDGIETSTKETTKIRHTTLIKTRKVHMVTTMVTRHVRKNNYKFSTVDETPTYNKTTSIVTPTFPLPVARCPRDEQPCIGAGFACNGYEFGQCVNNRWLMRPCSTDRVTACFNAGPDLVACDFIKGRSLQVCDDILAPLPYGRLASNVLFLRASDQEKALNTPVFPSEATAVGTTTRIKKKSDSDDESSNSDTDDDDDDYVYNKYGEKRKNTAHVSVTDLDLVKQSSGVNLIDDHNRREDPAMLMVKDPENYYGPDGHVRAVGGNVVDDLREHNSYGTKGEPYDENPPVDEPEEGDVYSDGDEFMRKRDAGAWEFEDVTELQVAPDSSEQQGQDQISSESGLTKRDINELSGEGATLAHIYDKDWLAQVEDFYTIYALYVVLSGTSQDSTMQDFEHVLMDHTGGDFLVPPRILTPIDRALLARFTFVPVGHSDDNPMYHRGKDGLVEEEILVVVRTLTNDPIPKRWKIALPLAQDSTMLSTTRGSFFADSRVSPNIRSLYQQRVGFYNKYIRINTNSTASVPEEQILDDLAAGHSTNETNTQRVENLLLERTGSGYRRSLVSADAISNILRLKPDPPPPEELLYEPIADDPAGRLYEVRSDPDSEKDNNMALSFTIKVKVHLGKHNPVIAALPHPILSFITTY